MGGGGNGWDRYFEMASTIAACILHLKALSQRTSSVKFIVLFVCRGQHLLCCSVSAIMPPLQFWKPGAAAPGSTLDRESESEGSSLLLSLASSSSKANQSLSISAQRTRLPIYKHREKLLYCIEKYGVTIVVGQTGCGKSTRELFSFCLGAPSLPQREKLRRGKGEY